MGLNGTHLGPDRRVVYGARCTYWGSIHSIKTRQGSGLPCCPHCMGVLFEVNSEEEFLKGVIEYNATHEGYLQMILWSKEGKCYQNMAQLEMAYSRAHL